jgi:hypothetical protein
VREAKDALQLRYANGEIDREEYLQGADSTGVRKTLGYLTPSEKLAELLAHTG